MVAPRPSELDFSQCIQGAYDDALGRLRVEGQATIVNGALEVSINATDDNIAIKDPSSGNVLKINSDGSINVNTSFSGTIAVGTVDETNFAYGSSTQLTIGGVYQDTGASLTPGQSGAARLTQNRALHSNLRNSAGTEISSSSPGAASNQLLHTQTPDTTTNSTVLGALNASITIPTAGLNSVGFQILAGSLIGTLTPYLSIDGGVTFVATSFYNPLTGSIIPNLVFGSANTTQILSVALIGGTSHVQVGISAYTSGSANAMLRASTVSGLSAAVVTSAFGTVTPSNVALPSAAVTLILAANANRKYAYISNVGGSQIQIQFGTSSGLTSTTGLIIASKGFYELKGDNLFTGNIYAYCANSITISVAEGTP